MLLNLIIANVAVEEVNNNLEKIKSEYEVKFVSTGKKQYITYGDSCLWDSDSDLEFRNEWKLAEYIMNELFIRMQITFY